MIYDYFSWYKVNILCNVIIIFLVDEPKSFSNARKDYARADACERFVALVRSLSIIIDISCKLFSRKVIVYVI